MNTLTIRAFVLAVAAVSTCDAAWGNNPVTQNFDEQTSKHFIGSSKRSYALRKSKKLNKPIIVLLTKKGCGACQNLKQSVNMDSAKLGLDTLLSNFVVVHAEGAEMEQWQGQGEGYAPQTYFFAPGEDQPLPVLGTSKTSPHFFHDADTLKWGMETAIKAVETGARSNTEL